MQRRIAQLGGVVRRDRRRHADGNAGGAVGKQVREGARQDDRFARFPRHRWNGNRRRPRQCPQQQLGHRGHLGLGVTHGGRVVAVDIAEIALTVDQRVAHGEILRQPHQRIVDRLVAMRVEITHHLADDLGRFLETAIRAQAHIAHRVDDAAMDRLQAVAHIRQGPVHDGRQAHRRDNALPAPI